MVFAAILGLAFCAAGLVWLWQSRPKVQAGFATEAQLISDTLAATSQGLEVAGESLQIARDNTRAIEDALITATDTISTTTPLLDTLADVVGENLPGTLAATTTSLDSAQSSAKIIEDILGAITSIPFMPLDPYEPEVPLHLALGRVSADLSELPANLLAIESNVRASRRNLDVVEADLRLLVLQIGQIDTGLADAQNVVRDYQDILERLSLRIETLQDRFPIWLNRLTWLGSAILLWIAISQLGLLMHGLELARTGG